MSRDQQPFAVTVKGLISRVHSLEKRVLKLEGQRDARDSLPLVALVVSVVGTLIAISSWVFR